MSAVGDDAARLETLARLARSRAEIRRVLEPPPRIAHSGGEPGDSEDHRSGVFPRSRTMRLLTSGRGIGTLGAMVGGLVMARPGLAFKVIRKLPTGTVARMLLLKAVTAFRSRQ